MINMPWLWNWNVPLFHFFVLNILVPDRQTLQPLLEGICVFGLIQRQRIVSSVFRVRFMSKQYAGLRRANCVAYCVSIKLPYGYKNDEDIP